MSYVHTPIVPVDAFHCVTPVADRGKAPPDGTRNRHPRGGRHGEPQLSGWMQMAPALDAHGGLPSARKLDDIERGIAGLIRDERDATAVRRPPWSRRVPIPISELQRVGAVGGHQPELIPLPAEIG